MAIRIISALVFFNYFAFEPALAAEASWPTILLESVKFHVPVCIYSEDNNLVVGNGHTIRRINEPVKKYEINSWIRALTCSKNAEFIAIGSDNDQSTVGANESILEMWNVIEMERVAFYNISTKFRKIISLALSPCNRFIAAGFDMGASGDTHGLVIIYNLNDKKIHKMIFEYYDHIKSLKFTHDDQYLAVQFSNNSKLHFYKYRSLDYIINKPKPSIEIISDNFALDNFGLFVAVVCQANRKCSVYKMSDLEPLNIIEIKPYRLCHSAPFLMIDSHRKLLAIEDGSLIRICRLDVANCSMTIKKDIGIVESISFLPGKYVQIVYTDFLKVWMKIIRIELQELNSF